MDTQKREFLTALFGAAAVVPLGILAHSTFAQHGTGGRVVPTPPDNMPDPSAQPPVFDPKKIQQHNQKVILDDVQKLYKLAGELKDQVEKTDSTSTLSLSMVQKAKEVEKLAKQIASLAVG
jgi:hypothetical protein